MSYPKSAIKGAGLTLPSIEGGLGTLNILRDPPRGIHTRYIEKVSDTNQLVKTIDASGDRICEAINKFARGIDPMVSVSYSNNGTNGGQMRDTWGSGKQGIASIGQSYYPHRIMRDGEFRPPIIPPQSLLPLSRQPRLPESYQTNAGSELTVVQNLSSCANTDTMKHIRKELLQMCLQPKSIFNIEQTPTETVDVKYSIQSDKPNVVAETNLYDPTTVVNSEPKYPERGIVENKRTIPIHTNTNDMSMEPVFRNDGPEKGVVDNRVYAEGRTNKYDNTVFSMERNERPERGILNEKTYSQTFANKNDTSRYKLDVNYVPGKEIKATLLEGSLRTNQTDSNIQSHISDFQGCQPISLNQPVYTNMKSNTRGVEQQKYMHSEQTLRNKLPSHNVSTNRMNSGIDMNGQLVSRDYHLPERADRGGFMNNGFQPNTSRTHTNPSLEREPSVYKKAARLAFETKHTY